MARRALIISCGTYDTADFAPLVSAVPDAERLGALLGKRNTGGYAVSKLINPDLIESQVAIYRLLADASPADLIILYLSGHGVKDAYGRFYLALPSTDPASLPATSLSGRFIRERMADTDARLLVVILDTCFAGAFGRDLVAKSIASAAGLPQELIEGRETERRGHVVMAASSAIQYAFETAGNEPTSLFTRTICDGIENGRADLDADGWVSLQDLVSYTSEKMHEESRAQTPEVSYLGVNAQIRLVKAPNRIAAAELDSELNTALESRHDELRLAAARVLGSYAKDPNRKRSSLARARLRSLENDENDEVRMVVRSSLGRVYRPRHTTATFKYGDVAVSSPANMWASLHGKTIRIAAEQAPMFASFGNDLPILSTVSLRLSEAHLEIYATDRYRIDWRVIRALASDELPFFALVSADDFTALRSLPDDAEVRVALTDREVYFSVGDSTLRLRREFFHKIPGIEDIVSDVGPTFATSRLAVVEAVESLVYDDRVTLDTSIAFCASSSSKHVLEISGDVKGRLKRNTVKMGIPARGSLPSATVRLDHQRLLEALDTFNQDIIYFDMSRIPGPALLLSANKDADHRHAIMPFEPQ